MLMERLIRFVAMHPHLKIDRAARIQRTNHFGRFFRQGRQQCLVNLDFVTFGLEPAGGFGERMHDFGRQSHRLAPAVGRET